VSSGFAALEALPPSPNGKAAAGPCQSRNRSDRNRPSWLIRNKLKQSEVSSPWQPLSLEPEGAPVCALTTELGAALAGRTPPSVEREDGVEQE